MALKLGDIVQDSLRAVICAFSNPSFGLQASPLYFSKASTTTSVMAITPSSSSVRPMSCSPTGSPSNSSGSSVRRAVSLSNGEAGGLGIEGLTKVVDRLVLGVAERVRGRGRVARFVDGGDGEDGRGAVEVVPQRGVEVVPARGGPHVRGSAS